MRVGISHLVFWILLTLLPGVSSATEKELLDLAVTSIKKLKVPELEPAAVDPPGRPAAYRRTLNTIGAFDQKFWGYAWGKEGNLEKFALGVADIRLKPDAARELFRKIARALRQRLGSGKVVRNVPNFEDGNRPEINYVIWQIEDELLLLDVILYSARGGVTLTRTDRDAWRKSLGQDLGKFWDGVLKEISK